MQKRPIFFLAFANNVEQGNLPGLKTESKALRKTLLPVHDSGQIELFREQQADTKDIPELLTQYKDRIALFHYGGHGDGKHLYFENSKGHAAGLSQLLKLQGNLKLVFLNACATQEQAAQYVEAGIPCVIATTISIIDDHATYFAKCFYEALAKEFTIKAAFDAAVGAIRLKTNKYEGQLENKVFIYRGSKLRKAKPKTMPWRIYVHEDHQELLNWKIPKASKLPQYLTQLPSLSDEIIGRDDDLQKLRAKLLESSKVVLMNGMGGIGKMTTAIAYANCYKKQYRHIVWIEQLRDFATDMASNHVLARNLGITPSNDVVADAQTMLNSLSNLPGESLLILDNGNEQLKQFAAWFPKAPDWHVLITSRQELGFAELIPLGFLSAKDALQLFYKHYDFDRNDALVQSILQTIDYHTLTIEILAKTAQSLEIRPLQKIVALLEERGIQIGKPVDFSAIAHRKKEQATRLFDYLLVIFELPGISEDETWLLKQFIALPPIFIDWDFLIELLQIPEEDEPARDNLTFARNSLKKKGWLIYNKEQKAYKMHRIIQDVLQEKLAPEYEDVKPLIKSISRLLYIDQAKDNPVEKFPFVKYGERILQIITGQTDELFAVFQSNLATVYKDLGDYEQARDLLKQALESDIENFGQQHPETAIKRSNLATVYQALGDYEQAKALFQKAFDSFKLSLGEQHPNTQAVKEWLDSME